MPVTFKNKIDFSPMKIIKGEQLYSVASFIQEMRYMFLWDDPEIDKNRLNILIDQTIYNVAEEVENEDSELMNFKHGDAETSISNVFDMQHVEKWYYLKFSYCLLAHFWAMKLYRKLDSDIEHPDTDRIIGKFKLSFENFREDWNNDLAKILEQQTHELDKLKD